MNTKEAQSLVPARKRENLSEGAKETLLVFRNMDSTTVLNTVGSLVLVA